MSRAKSRPSEQDPIEAARKVISLSDEEFDRWLNRVISSGRKPGR